MDVDVFLGIMFSITPASFFLRVVFREGQLHLPSVLPEVHTDKSSLGLECIPGQPSRLSCSQAPSLTSSFLHMNTLELFHPRRGTGVGHSAAPSFEVLLSTDLSSRAVSVRSRYEHHSLFIPTLWDHIYSPTLRRLTSSSLRSIPTYPTMAKTAPSGR